ncbi:MAG TPA: hypothetical protein VFI06_13780 [Chitinophagaceae bacterium]|nr:hypothetical protein [Chitinophagaceae bacterium]
MKSFILYCCLLLASTISAQKLQEINPLLHDESFIAFFGTAPDETTNEQLRVRTHLAYVEQLLRTTTSAELNSSQQEKRTQVLDLLHQYWEAGQFPVNRGYPGERRPCFIDAEGNICAVGYLVEQTRGRELAEAINVKHQYEFLSDMHDPAINAWADEYGLTIEECAMIQPSYYYIPPGTKTNADIKTGYGASSGVVAGGNIAISVIQLSNWSGQGKGLAVAGLISGTGQIILGAVNIKKPGQSVSYSRQNNLSYVNIGLGTATLLTSALNLAMNKKNKQPKNAFNLYSYPNYANSISFGFAFSRRI